MVRYKHPITMISNNSNGSYTMNWKRILITILVITPVLYGDYSL